MINEDAHPGIGGRVLKTAQPEAPLGFAVDGRVQYIPVEHEAEGNKVRDTSATDGAEPRDRRRCDARTHFFQSHDQILR